ncbi:anaerobic sulfite reductase subunit AsrA [Brachyspira pilosicoli]|uniref:anaerobic sulfite reductase subunit AsrA n=1 Tax=Brachyspira pilosicoli TaxID=52584 RepID=UPI001CA4D717|nr:anaerobic sulfite reductase subunit AsrA [Brachyspira pilosicoli]MBW5396285.1 anaerobic sulfite reductase subunit A [Brachyspira pilosicoli]
MGYKLDKSDFQNLIDNLKKYYLIYAPKNFKGTGTFSDTDIVRYDYISNIDDIEFNKKSNYSFKESILPITQTLFYFTEDEVKEANIEREKPALIFLRSCDLHAIKRLDQIYLKNGFEDYYYKRLRDNIKFVLIGCSKSFDNCFCVSMNSNKCDEYDFALNIRDNYFEIDCKNDEFKNLFKQYEELNVEIDYVRENDIKVKVAKNLSLDVYKSKMWDEYDARCINCGRCNFVCPTCTCFTMQDIFYTDNGKVGERRRVHASCMVDEYTDVAGGGAYRKKNGERMRFKVMHKVFDYKKRNGYTMCVGCGRCDDACPEYISYSNCINKLEDAMKEVSK